MASGGLLQVANLGDSGFRLIRNGCTVYKSEVWRFLRGIAAWIPTLWLLSRPFSSAYYCVCLPVLCVAQASYNTMPSDVQNSPSVMQWGST
jgi:hypothetical protein